MPMAEEDSYDFGRILSDKDEEEKQRFCSWFWSGTNGNKLIAALNLNNSESKGSQIRRVHEGQPHIYCVVLNDNNNPGKNGNVQWRYCKVGITHVDTTTGRGNRMETVQKEIKDNTGKEAAIVFVLPVKASDSRQDNAIEKSVRERVGLPVNKKLAHLYKFPVITEWVITTQAYIDSIVKKKTKTAAGLDTGFILELISKFKQLGKLPTNLMCQNGEVVLAPQP